MTVLSQITSPADLKNLPTATLGTLAQEIREFIIAQVSEAGGTWDRAGITGPDRPSHLGMWDPSILPIVPGLRIAAPRDCTRLRELLRKAIEISDGPTVIRYPKTTLGPDIPAIGRIGQCDVLRDDPAAIGLLVAIGALAGPCLIAADELAAHNVPVNVVNPRWIAPLDPALLTLAGANRLVLIVEDTTTTTTGALGKDRPGTRRRRIRHLRSNLRPATPVPAARHPRPDPPSARPGRDRHRHRRAQTSRQHALRKGPKKGHCQGDPMTAVPLGMPPARVMPRRGIPPARGRQRGCRRRRTRLGAVHDHHPTCDINATLRQIAELTAAGCQIVRVAVPSQDDADALTAIAAKSQIPVIADIHFQPRHVFAAIDAGCAAVRVNPGNIKRFDDKVAQIARAARDANVPIRIGVNAGSLDPRLLAKYGRATPEALVESALWECSLLEENGFSRHQDLLKHDDPPRRSPRSRPRRLLRHGKGQIFVRGKVVKTVPEHQIVQALLDEARQRDWTTPPEWSAERARLAAILTIEPEGGPQYAHVDIRSVALAVRILFAGVVVCACWV